MADEAYVRRCDLNCVLGWLECVVELADGSARDGVDVAGLGVVRCLRDRPCSGLDCFLVPADRQEVASVLDSARGTAGDVRIADAVLSLPATADRLSQLRTRPDDLTQSAGQSTPALRPDPPRRDKTTDVLGYQRTVRFPSSSVLSVEALADGSLLVTFVDSNVVVYRNGFPRFIRGLTANGRQALEADIVLDQADILGSADFRAANAKLAENIDDFPEMDSDLRAWILENSNSNRSPTELGYTWHHHEETGRMQLVESDLHALAQHLGGAKLWGERTLAEFLGTFR